MGVSIIVIVGCSIVCGLIKRIKNNVTAEKTENMSVLDSLGNDEELSVKEQKCDDTMHQVYENTNEKNEMAKSVFTIFLMI